MFCLFVFLFCSFLYSVLRYSLSSPPRIAMLTEGYNGLCNLIEGNKVRVVVEKQVPPTAQKTYISGDDFSCNFKQNGRKYTTHWLPFPVAMETKIREFQ